MDEGTVDHATIHRSESVQLAGFWLHLYRLDLFRTGRPGVVRVYLDDRDLTPSQATALAGLLATTAATAEATEGTVVTTLDLPPDEDYVVFQDFNVVAVASRLDEDGRRRALSEAGAL